MDAPEESCSTKCFRAWRTKKWAKDLTVFFVGLIAFATVMGAVVIPAIGRNIA